MRGVVEKILHLSFDLSHQQGTTIRVIPFSAASLVLTSSLSRNNSSGAEEFANGR